MRDGRGWVLITHGYANNELEFLRSLGLFEMGQLDQGHISAIKGALLAHCDARNILKN